MKIKRPEPKKFWIFSVIELWSILIFGTIAIVYDNIVTGAQMKKMDREMWPDMKKFYVNEVYEVMRL